MFHVCIKSFIYDINFIYEDIIYWRCIEEAITRATRNRFDRKVTWVRIPPSPLLNISLNPEGLGLFLLSRWSVDGRRVKEVSGTEDLGWNDLEWAIRGKCGRRGRSGDMISGT